MTAVDPTSAFLEAAEAAPSTLRHETVAARWTAPSALAGLTIGALAAHLYVAARVLEALLDAEAPAEPHVVDLAGFYGINRVTTDADLDRSQHRFVREDASRRAEAGPATIVSRYERLVDRLRDRLPNEDLDRLVPVLQVPGGVTPLRTYLTTRIIEALVHTDDLAVSIGTDPPPPPGAAMSLACAAFVDLARARSGDAAVLRAFTRRERGDPDVLCVL